MVLAILPGATGQTKVMENPRQGHSEDAAHMDLAESVDTAQSWGEMRVPGPSLTTAVFRTQTAAQRRRGEPLLFHSLWQVLNFRMNLKARVLKERSMLTEVGQ